MQSVHVRAKRALLAYYRDIERLAEDRDLAITNYDAAAATDYSYDHIGRARRALIAEGVIIVKTRVDWELAEALGYA